MAEAGHITLLLQQAEHGDAQAANQLYQLVEDDLRKIARKRKRAAGSDVEASTTVLVNDAFLRLVGQDVTIWQPGDRRKFFGYISNKIHDFLIAELRKRQTQKRGGDRQRVELDAAVEQGTRGAIDQLELLIDLKAALERLENFARDDATLFRVRFFLDCTFEEAADILGISKTEAVRSYQRTILWLKRELKDYHIDR